MKHFEFADFVDEFKVPLVAISESEGYWTDDGKWVPGGPKEISMSGIVLPLTEDDLQYTEAGTYSVKDKKIYVLSPLNEGQKINYKGDIFTIKNFKDYSDYADVYIYFMRWREK